MRIATIRMSNSPLGVASLRKEATMKKWIVVCLIALLALPTLAPATDKVAFKKHSTLNLSAEKAPATNVGPVVNAPVNELDEVWSHYGYTQDVSGDPYTGIVGALVLSDRFVTCEWGYQGNYGYYEVDHDGSMIVEQEFPAGMQGIRDFAWYQDYIYGSVNGGSVWAWWPGGVNSALEITDVGTLGRGIAVDPATGDIYLSDWSALERLNHDGSGNYTLETLSLPPVAESVYGIDWHPDAEDGMNLMLFCQLDPDGNSEENGTMFFYDPDDGDVSDGYMVYNDASAGGGMAGGVAVSDDYDGANLVATMCQGVTIDLWEVDFGAAPPPEGYDNMFAASQYMDIFNIGTHCNMADDELVGPIDIYGDYYHYGIYYDEIYISSNGGVNFSGDSFPYTNGTIPSTSSPNNIIAPLWTDLNPSSSDDYDVVYYFSSSQNRFYVQWYTPYFGETDPINFQLVIDFDENVLYFEYVDSGTTGWDSDATVGVENQTGSDGLSMPASIINNGTTVMWYQPILDVEEGDATAELPTSYSLEQNYPNPFNPTTDIAFNLAAPQHVTLSVYNVMGQQVANLVNQPMQAGRHTVSFNGADLASGVYFYGIQAGSFQQMKRMVLMK
ncbi:T9SS type A sorting domain-containing protein [bacterium]|nr:T9SS type A sorting domain-containing protein [bacterium]